jgi:hypothetical protein
MARLRSRDCGSWAPPSDGSFLDRFSDLQSDDTPSARQASRLLKLVEMEAEDREHLAVYDTYGAEAAGG